MSRHGTLVSVLLVGALLLLPRTDLYAAKSIGKGHDHGHGEKEHGPGAKDWAPYGFLVPGDSAYGFNAAPPDTADLL